MENSVDCVTFHSNSPDRELGTKYNLIILIICIASNGTLGGFAHGISKKIKMLKEEGIKIENAQIDLKTFLYNL
mgnify:FL=1